MSFLPMAFRPQRYLSFICRRKCEHSIKEIKAIVISAEKKKQLNTAGSQLKSAAICPVSKNPAP